MSGVSIGQYFPGNSWLHRMDARVKFLLTFAYIIVIFFPKSWGGLLICVGFILFCVLLSRLPIKLIIRSVKPIIPIILLTSLLNIFYVGGENVLFSWKFITVTSEGISTAVFISVRIICLLVGSSLLMYTTTPTVITGALESLLSPFKIVKLNVHEIAMMMTIALRFVPILIDETNKIMAAQKSRGAMIDSGGPINRIKALIPILIPLFISSFRRAYELAMAMECRCYNGGEGRTKMKKMKTSPSDYVSVGFMVLFIAVVVTSNFFLTRVI